MLTSRPSAERSKLRLGPLPNSETVKLTFACPVALKADLECYAVLHAQAHGEQVDAAMLIPYMLAAFIARHQGFKRCNEQRRDPDRSTRSSRPPLTNPDKGT